MRISDWSSDVCSSDLFFQVCHEGPYISSSRPQPGRRKPLSENLGERFERGDKALLGVIAKILGVADRLQHAGMVAAQIRSEEHTSELQSLMRISYAVFCLKKKKHKNQM